jgi:hypothetical protein
MGDYLGPLRVKSLNGRVGSSRAAPCTHYYPEEQLLWSRRGPVRASVWHERPRTLIGDRIPLVFGDSTS